jgi:hypothetical protein
VLKVVRTQINIKNRGKHKAGSVLKKLPIICFQLMQKLKINGPEWPVFKQKHILTLNANFIRED